MAASKRIATARWSALTWTAVLSCLLPWTASAQLAPLAGGHYADHSAGAGGGGAGYYHTSVPLDLPEARDGLPVPLQVVYGGRAVGAAGMGWDVPLSYVFRSASMAHRRPNPTASIDKVPVHYVLALGGEQVELVRNAADTGWVGRRGSALLEVRADGDTGMVLYDGEGRTYRFSSVGATASSRLVNGDLYLLRDISKLSNTVHFEYTIGAPKLPPANNTALSINIASVSYNTLAGMTGCPTSSKHRIQLNYEPPLPDGSPALALSMLNGTVLARVTKLSSIKVQSARNCSDPYRAVRTYLFAYQADPDTGRPELQSVTMKGQDGKADPKDTLPIATYSYGSITDPANHTITFQDAPDTGPQFLIGSDNYQFGISFTWERASTEAHRAEDALVDLRTEQLFIDLNGDGRPDFWGIGAGLNRPGPNGTTTLTTPLPSGLPQSANGTGELVHSAVLNQSGAPLRMDKSVMNDTLRQFIDMNGDGRIDIVETVLPDNDHWIIHLNTPDPTDVTKTVWVDIKVPVTRMRAALGTTGITFGRVPMARKTTVPDPGFFRCWRWLGVWQEVSGGCDPGPSQRTQTIVEFQLQDVNGDGYPDFVYNASNVLSRNPPPKQPDTDGTSNGERRGITTVADMTGSKAVMVLLNTAGAHLKEGVDLFSASPIVLVSGADECGVARWQADPSSELGGVLNQVCGFEDVNGDGLVDRVRSFQDGTQIVSEAALGTGIPSHPFADATTIRLPGPLSRTESDLVPFNFTVRPRVCVDNPHGTFDLRRTRALRDINGDGIPDYIIGQVSQMQSDVGTWTVAMGTGTGFAAPAPVNSRLGLEVSRERSLCDDTQQLDGEVSATRSGLYDIDGDGQPEVVSFDRTDGKFAWQVLQLKPLEQPVADGFEFGPVVGIPGAGRLTRIDNGYGAVTRIGYISAKHDTQGIHNVPYPEIVVTAVNTTDKEQSPVNLSAPIHYAYHGARLMFDPAADAFVFPGYDRTVEMQSTEATKGGSALVTNTDRYGFAADQTQDITARFKRYLQAGHVKDVTTFAGDFGGNVWSVSVTDTSRISGAHYDWDARVLTTAATPRPPNNERCIDIKDPYDFAQTGSTLGQDWEDECTKRGFLFQKTVSTWRGKPGTADPFTSTATVKTRTDTRTVDEFGRSTTVALLNDGKRSQDDLCVRTVYAAPNGNNARVLTAPASRTVIADPCENDKLAPSLQETYEYDTSPAGEKLGAGKVAAGLLTSKVVSRRNAETGATIVDAKGASDIRAFDATYDADGALTSITMTRDDGATRTASVTYDGALLTPVSTSVTGKNADGTALPTLTTQFNFDPLNLELLETTDPNGTLQGTTYDGFGRKLASYVIPASGGPQGVVAWRVYLGFFIGDTRGRQVQLKTFADPVDAPSVFTSAGRVTATSLDPLGRPFRMERGLGADYNNILLSVERLYDQHGRVVVESDPHPPGESASTAYTTTYTFQATGIPDCIMRGNGPQALARTTNEAAEFYPTCVSQSFQDDTETVEVHDAASALAGSPQEGVGYRTQYTATGQALTQYTVAKDGSILEKSEFGYDPLGNLNQMIRRDLQHSNEAVTTNWHYDNLGQLLELDEPDVAAQFRTYSNWGELVQTQWTDTTTQTPTDRRIVTRYDGFGRVVQQDELNNGLPDITAIKRYTYDQPSTLVSQLTPTNVLGRLASASTTFNDIVLSYDDFGRVNARGFKDGDNYVEKHTYFDDGSAKRLELLLPDNGFKSEHIDYTYDSAGRPRTVKYSDDTISQDIFTATGSADIDAFGRIRHALYGAADFAANYADTGRRLPKDVTVTSPVGVHSRKIAYAGTAFDPLGRERARSDSKDGLDTNWAFTYDALGRLAKSKRTLGGVVWSDRQYSFDSLGNLLSQTDTAVIHPANVFIKYQTADRDRICSVSLGVDTGPTDCSFKYDSTGSVTQMPTQIGSTATSRTFIYNNSGQVKGIITAGPTTASLSYDAFGELRALRLESNLFPDTRADRHFGPLMGKRDETVDGTKTSVVLRHIPAPGVLATRHGTTGTWTFAFADTRGNRFVTDQTGAFLQDIEYDAYGRPTSTGAQPGAATYTSEQWNGGDYLSALGLSQLGARMYDPVIGRFLRRDPLLIPRTATTTNPYAFADNDPVNFSDPSGLTVSDACAEEHACYHREDVNGGEFGPLNEGFEGGEYRPGNEGFEGSEFSPGGEVAGGQGEPCWQCGPVSTPGGLGTPGTLEGGGVRNGDPGGGGASGGQFGLPAGMFGFPGAPANGGTRTGSGAHGFPTTSPPPYVPEPSYDWADDDEQGTANMSGHGNQSRRPGTPSSTNDSADDDPGEDADGNRGFGSTVAGGNRGGGRGGQGKGERGRSAKTDGNANPGKHARPDPDRPGEWLKKDPHTGKWVPAQKGWRPNQRGMLGAAASVGAGYLIWRGIRLLPSIVFPPLWPTIPANAAVP